MTMMPIQRQSDAYEALNGSNLRWAKEYETRDLPEGLVNALSRGVGITSGLNNPRAMAREAVDVSGMDPNAHAYATEAPYGPADSGGAPRDYNPYAGYEPTDRDEQQGEAVSADDASGYNWGPEPQGDTQFREPTPTPTGDVQGFGFGQGMPGEDYDPHSSENVGGQLGDYDEQFGPHTASFGEAHLGGPASIVRVARDAADCNMCQDIAFHSAHENLIDQGKSVEYADKHAEEESKYNLEDMTCHHDTTTAKIAVAPAVQNGVVPGWVGHGYVPGHRIALPLPQGNFQGTVTHLAGPEVGIRWDDGQHSTEEPANLRPL